MQPVTTSGFRPSIDAKLERKSLHATEYRLAAGMTRIAGFDDDEQDIAIDEIILNVPERKALTSRPVCLFTSIRWAGSSSARAGLNTIC